MSDQTVYAEQLIMTIARAFYDDEAVCLIDVLIRDKFLRDDDMGSRLSLPPKQLRKTLQFLQEEHLVKYELVDDLVEGGSQATKFWYIDYNHAVNSIRLRIYLLGKKLEDAEIRARSSSTYLCPGYKTKACNGRYTETEAQQVVDSETGLFLCQECFKAHIANPDPPPMSSYTLQLVDNTKALKQASNNLRRVKVQLSAKMIGKQQLRMGIYDLLQKVRGVIVPGQEGHTSVTAGPLTSNLPSENRALNIGTKRLVGTGRTASIKLKKLKEQMGEKAAHKIKKYLGGTTRDSEDDLTFLKNALGQHIAFELEKGAGARAHLLVSKNFAAATRDEEETYFTERWAKRLDVAAIRIGVEQDLITLLVQHYKKRELEQKDAQGSSSSFKKRHRKELFDSTLPFLRNNIGRLDEEGNDTEYPIHDVQHVSGITETDPNGIIGVAGYSSSASIVEPDQTIFDRLNDDEKRTAFQNYYKKELQRQRSILNIRLHDDTLPHIICTDTNDEASIPWEDG